MIEIGFLGEDAKRTWSYILAHIYLSISQSLKIGPKRGRKKGSMNPSLSTFLKYVFAKYVFTL